MRREKTQLIKLEMKRENKNKYQGNPRNQKPIFK
jgi:hypothetical protein